MKGKDLILLIAGTINEAECSVESPCPVKGFARKGLSQPDFCFCLLDSDFTLSSLK